MWRKVLPVLGRLAITAFAFWWIFRLVDVGSLRHTLISANRSWLLLSAALFFLAQLACVWRWRLLVPPHPSLTWPFLANSFFVGSFFNTFLPTTVGGDVIRGYDLIKATGEWKGSLASLLMDRLIGLTGFLLCALGAWILFLPARQDPVIRTSFLSFCLLVLLTFSVLGSRRLLHLGLQPFGKIGLGQLQSHAKQFQETLLAYFRRPKTLSAAFGVSLVVQGLAILMFAAVSKALALPIPIVFLILTVPMVMTISQIPISLNGWGVREGATILLLKRINIGAPEALSLSLVCAAIPLLSGAIGGILFLTRRRRKQIRPS
ncbi:MAG: flippase-like domain-containing protein [Candidatus Omnitrophica bacterium]|nr:flippase-like domain-containing protein [Candidatus Omnitrophota bacterium]